MNYKEFFKDKKIAVVGLGPHGEMVADIKFLLRVGAVVSFFDMRSENRLQGFVQTLKESGLSELHLGKVQGDALTKFDLIILSSEISKKSGFLRKAHEAGIRTEYANVLFLKLAPAITLIGVMGLSGKSTVSQMIYGILKKSFSEYEDQGLFFIDPDLPNGALTHLKKIKAGDVVLARIPEEFLSEYYSARISPHVAVITTAIPFNILEHQIYNNFVVAPDNVIDEMRDNGFNTKAKMLRTKDSNASLAMQTGQLFKVPAEHAQKVIDEFTGLKGRQEFVKKVGGVEFYNDAASINPISTLYALKNFSQERNIILIFGGAYTGHDYAELIKNIPLYASTVVLLPGSGTLGFRSDVENLEDINFFQAPTLEDAVILAKGQARKGDKVVFSPGCEAIGIYISRKERGEKFVKAVRSL